MLTSEELRAKGYKPNNCLIDQRTAFKWVKQHIAGFGGDPDNITVIGESAGAVATTLHLYSKEKLFNRAVATGGSALLIPVMDPPVQEGIYKQFISALALDALSTEERIQKLLTLPLDEVIAKLPPSIPFLPTLDGDILNLKPTFATVADPKDDSMPGKQWADALAVGNSEFDVSRVLATGERLH
jgi:carboxylesterase type B